MARNLKLGCPEHLGMEDPTVISGNFTFSLSLLLCYNTKVAHMGFPDSSTGKESCNAGDLGSSPGLGRSPGQGDGNPLQCSCLENSMNRGAWWATVHGVTKSWIQLSN